MRTEQGLVNAARALAYCEDRTEAEEIVREAYRSGPTLRERLKDTTIKRLEREVEILQNTRRELEVREVGLDAYLRRIRHLEQEVQRLKKDPGYRMQDLPADWVVLEKRVAWIEEYLQTDPERSDYAAQDEAPKAELDDLEAWRQRRPWRCAATVEPCQNLADELEDGVDRALADNLEAAADRKTASMSRLVARALAALLRRRP